MSNWVILLTCLRSGIGEPRMLTAFHMSDRNWTVVHAGHSLELPLFLTEPAYKSPRSKVLCCLQSTKCFVTPTTQAVRVDRYSRLGTTTEQPELLMMFVFLNLSKAPLKTTRSITDSALPSALMASRTITEWKWRTSQALTTTWKLLLISREISSSKDQSKLVRLYTATSLVTVKGFTNRRSRM